jgi:N-acyl homoserine lactone hydrolase
VGHLCPRDWEERWVPTGLHEFFPYDRVTEEQYLDRRLAQLGLGPEQLDFVVFSHLHFDHAGNAKMFQGNGPRLVVNDKEREFAFGFDGLFTGPTSRATTRGWSSRPSPATPSSCPG